MAWNDGEAGDGFAEGSRRMAKDGHKQTLGVMAPPRADGPAVGTVDEHVLLDNEIPAPPMVRQADEDDRYISHTTAPHATAPRVRAVDAASGLTAEISASAVRHNLSLLRSLIPADTAICAAVKADCYGHGLSVLADVIARQADVLAVATADEALRLREMGYDGRLLMLFTPGSHASQDLLAALVAADVTLTIASHHEVDPVAQAAQRAERRACVHVKIDTGMGRGGVVSAEAARLVAHIRATDAADLRGLYTHLACADEADKTAANEQMACFDRAVDACSADGLTLHAANSAAVIDMPSTHLHMVRPGIAVYGYQSSDEMVNHAALQPALRLTGRLMQVKDVEAGSKCGYGLTHTFDRPSRIGLVPVGYADGYLRAFSNRATMRIAGRDVPVRGRVSMDQTIIDLTDVPEARCGDEVEIISSDPSAPHSVEALARLAGTIPYEITCHLGNRVTRTLVD